MMIYILFFSLTMSATEFPPAVSQYIQKLGVSKPLIGLQYVGALNQTSNPKNVFFDKTRWQEFNREEKEIIINYLIVKNAEQKISPFKSLYLRVFKALYCWYKNKQNINDCILFGALYNENKIYENPLQANILQAHYRFDISESNYGKYSLPFQYYYSGKWKTLSTLDIDENTLTVTAYYANNRTESKSMKMPTKNIYSIYFLDGRLCGKDTITTEADKPMPRGILITFNNGMQVIWRLPHTTHEKLDLIEDNTSYSFIPYNVRSLIIPVNFARNTYGHYDSYEYALHLHKRFHQLKRPSQFLARFNCTSML